MNGLAEIRKANAPRPDFQKRHFRTIANAIKATRNLPHDSAQEAIADLVETLVATFKVDNADFNEATFRGACGVTNGHQFTEANR